MAKKITISYNENPQVADAFGFALFLDGLAIPIGAFLGVNVNYYQVGLPNNAPFQIAILPSLSQTIENTIGFLNGSYSHPSITYAKVNDTIEVFVNIENLAVTTSEDSGGRFSLSVQDVEYNEDFNLIYFFEYNNVNGDVFLCRINKKNYSGGATQIYGKATITKGSAKDHLDTFRGTGLDIQLEANKNLTLSDLYTDDEQSFTVRFYKNNKLVFRGFLKPDDVFESFVQDAWYINFTAIDGLGVLENLSFVQDNGLFFVGKMKAFDIVYYCLKRTGISMKINTYINTYYDGLIPSDTLDPLQKIYIIADRFVKTDNNTIMSCEEVLKSVLDIFQAVITQVDGEWYIYKPNELYVNQYPKFRRYNEAGVYLGLNTKNITGVLGSQINNFYPHHCGANQRKKIKGAISAFRLGYKYGTALGLVANSGLKFNGNILNPYDDWTINFPDAAPKLIFDPTKEKGLFSLPLYAYESTLIKLATSDSIDLPIDFEYTFKGSFKLNVFNFSETYSIKIRAYFAVRIGIYYLDIDGNWTTTPTKLLYEYKAKLENDTNDGVFTFDFQTKTKPLPVAGLLYVEIYTTKAPDIINDPPSETFKLVSEFTYIDLIPSENTTHVGEFHTVQRKNKPSSLVKENNTVYNGDRFNKEYIGDIFKENTTTPTSLWFRKGVFEKMPLLRIAAEDELRMQQKPLVDFYGDVYGEMPYLSIITIDNIQGKFMPIEWQYDTVRNICNIRYLEIYAEELSDIDYVFTFDYGNTVKPTIKG